MAPAYKLTYFNVKGLGEPIRFLLSYGGIDFEDDRFEDEDWPSIKPNTPYEQVPILEINGKVAFQSVSICRYLAKQVKLVGKDNWEDLEIDATVDSIVDLRTRLLAYKFEEDEKVKQSKKDSIFNETIPFYLKRLDAQAKKNNGYLVGGHLTWADLFISATLDCINEFIENDLAEKYPNLLRVRTNVVKIPNIKSWIERRPDVPE